MKLFSKCIFVKLIALNQKLPITQLDTHYVAMKNRICNYFDSFSFDLLFQTSVKSAPTSHVAIAIDSQLKDCESESFLINTR